MKEQDSAALDHTPDASEGGTSLSFQNVDPVSIDVRNLQVAVSTNGGIIDRVADIFASKKSKADRPSRTEILKHVSLSIPSGSLMAVIGGSGSGKTSLLNVLSERMSGNGLKIEGDILYNGCAGVGNVKHAYVLQQDILQPRLTCRETLQYAADLRLPSSTTKRERSSLVEDIILELGLKECADTLVGDSEHKGLSGGEKRRLSIGIQLLANPSVLFLDEPTTGLDANSAYLLVDTCRKLAAKGRTLLMTLHQPRSDIFFLFDSVTVLTKGRLVYTGDVNRVVPYFEGIGHPFPEHVNPADTLIDLSAIDNRSPEQEATSYERVNKLVSLWDSHCSSHASDVAIEPAKVSKKDNKLQVMKAPLRREISVQVRRFFLLSIRDPMGLLGLFLECTLMGVIIGWIFYNLDGSLAGIRSKEGLIYTATSAQSYLLLLYETYRLCGPDLKVFDRERNEGCVSVFGYLVSRRIAKCLTEDLFVPLIFSVIVYFMVGLRTDGARYFFVFFANNLLMHYVAMTNATFCASISRDFTNAVLVANLGYTLQSMACGFFVNAAHMPVYVRWTKWIAYLYYGFSVSIGNEFNGYMGDCPFPVDDPACVPYSGDYIISTLGLPKDWITVPICVVLAWSVGFYIVAGILLKYLRVTVSVSRTYNSKQDRGLEELEIMDRPITQISVVLSDIHLSVSKGSYLPSIPFIRSSKKTIPILNGVSASFEPGTINAILGPSGSGKSSLLNYLANRIHSNALQRYTESGSILFNGIKPSSRVIQSICSYVVQDDEGLLPTLTVRETLYYAAYLRLPKHMSRRQKRARADDVILKMGLKDCADRLIGGEFIKGISGGERRRVTICIQLLNDPKVLLLDEPTSGLDSFTALSILQVLRALADEGRTIICTIHQPRSDLFTQFGNILLLAKGGKVAYNGRAAEMLDYFARIGLPCPRLTNPADHFLDQVSINLQEAHKEHESRERVNKLLEQWKLAEKQNEKALDTLEAGDSADLPAQFNSMIRERASFKLAFVTLLGRGCLNFARSPHIMIARIMQVVGIGIILALFFSPLKDGMVGITDRLGLVQEITALYFVGMLNTMAVYPQERSVFYREHEDNLYGVLPFLSVYTTIEVPFEVITALIFSVFVIMAPGLSRTVEMFFATAYSSFVIVNCGESLGIIFNTFFLHEGFAINIVSVILSVGSIMGGILSLNMPGFLKGVNYLSPLKYSLSVLVNMAFSGETFSCDGQETSSDGSCAFDTGEKVLQNYGLKADVPTCLGALAVCLVVYRLIALAILEISRLKLGNKRWSRQ